MNNKVSLLVFTTILYSLCVVNGQDSERKANPTRPCSIPNDCIGIPDSLCAPNGMCRCREDHGYSPSTGQYGQCFPIRQLNQPCTRHEECQVGHTVHAFCPVFSDGRPLACACKGDTVQANGNCYSIKTVVGSDCESNEECSVIVSGTECKFGAGSKGKCECSAPYIAKSSTECVLGVKAGGQRVTTALSTAVLTVVAAFTAKLTA